MSATADNRMEDREITVDELVIAIKGAGEMASAVAWSLFRANIRKIFMLEIPRPLAVRREVAFSEAVHDGHKTVEGVRASLCRELQEIRAAWKNGGIAVVVDPSWQTLQQLRPDAMVDAILAKKNLGSHPQEASLTIALGPGFSAGRDVDVVIETNRGHNLGRIITAGPAEPNTGIPGAIGGFSKERVLRAPVDGEFHSGRSIGELVQKDEVVGSVAGQEIRAQIGGVIRGLLRSPNVVRRGIKVGDIDPRGDKDYCYTISDKARTIAGAVLEATLRTFNGAGKRRPP